MELKLFLLQQETHHIIYIITVFCDNDVCVAAAVFKNVLNGAFNGRDALNGALQAAILCFQWLCWSWPKSE